MKNIASLLILGLLPNFANAADSPKELTIERIFQSPALQGTTQKNLEISPDGKHVTFLQGKKSDYERLDLWEYDIISGKTKLLMDSNKLSSGPEELSDEEKGRRERMRLSGSGIVSYQWAANGKALLFPLAGDAYYYHLGDKKAQRLLQTPEFETDLKLSPKGNYLSYVRAQDLFIKHIETGVETRLTYDGKGPIKNAMAEFVAQEEMSRRTGYWWSPDESHIAFTQINEAPVAEITRSEIYADSIKMITQRYPSAGTNNVVIKLATVNISNKQKLWINLGADPDIYLARVKWMKDSKTLTYQKQSRDQQTLELNTFNIQDMSERTLLKENSNTWVNLNDDLHFLNDQKHFIWASEKDGFKHLYLYKNNGELVRQLTSGKWVVDKIESIDEVNQQIYFTGRADTPTQRHLYKIGLNGGDIEKVTQRSAFHDISFSDDASVYIDSFSTTNTPQQVSLHKASGEQVTWLNQNQVEGNHPLTPYMAAWVEPTISNLVTKDGTELYYRLYKPKNIEGKHPVIVYQYGGPGAQVVTDKWGGNRGLLMQYWVSKGYIVFSLDNRGSEGRGKAFEDPIYKKMGSIELTDQIAGVEFLRTLPYVDKDRIGVYGHSYGGYMTLMAMFKGGDYFAAGVAGAPVTDWTLYDTHYTERFMGHPKVDASAYKASSVFPYAKDLKGDLLIYHGMADDNVLFTHSTKLYKHLQDLGIPFESMDYPGKKHSIRGKNTGIHLYKTITNFFDKHLEMN
ncbi:DPP IV N-terminal domain-containing protein [Paraglaciecola sp. 2405UD69-4]|uniref:S9 family peptidase n=1 Tax=Paraglaciecola sp. 2405UD69-4 TaxID=3391836 RepID=UPI0039C9B5F6